MSTELFLSALTALYAACSALRLVAYLPQLIAIARDRSGAHAISLLTWTFWGFSHAVTALYSALLLGDALLAGMMVGNALGCAAVTGVTMIRRRPERLPARVAPISSRQPPAR